MTAVVIEDVIAEEDLDRFELIEVGKILKRFSHETGKLNERHLFHSFGTVFSHEFKQWKNRNEALDDLLFLLTQHPKTIKILKKGYFSIAIELLFRLVMDGSSVRIEMFLFTFAMPKCIKNRSTDKHAV